MPPAPFQIRPAREDDRLPLAVLLGEIGMAVARDWRGRGVGSALLAAAIKWARERGLHKLGLGVFAHNTAAIGLYLKFGFVEEGRRIKHYRRANGDLWDSVEMGLLL